MRKLKRLVIACVVVAMSVCALFSFTACDDRETIAVVAKGETHAFWVSVKSGAEAAGEKYGYRVTFRGPNDESSASIPQQKEQVSSAVTGKNTKALVIATIGQGFGDYLKAAKEKGIPVVEFDSGIYDKSEIPSPSPVVSSVATSNTLAAALAAENFYNTTLKAKIEAVTEGVYKVGIIQHDGSQTGIDRANGFNDKLIEMAKADNLDSKLETKIEQADNTPDAYKNKLDLLQTWGASAIFMCNEGVVKECQAAVSTNATKYKDMLFCGFDAGTAQTNWIKDAGKTYALLVGSVAQDSYGIGYNAVEQAAKALKGETVTKEVPIAGTWYTTENIDSLIESNIVYQG